MGEDTVEATIGSGIIEGFTRDGVNRWRSIPYACPPIGPLRWQAPRQPDPWRGVRRCHEFTYCAPQERKYTMVGLGAYQPMSEDCLTLNVTAPRTRPDERLPVMVFIHGGAYIMGSSATPFYDGAAFARQGCIFVSVNYRLGALGCLDLSSLSDAENTFDDNLFLRDVVLALTWVRDNIAVFGGDPSNVTIFGESAGAHTVATLLTVPSAEGLFAQAISQSPTTALSHSPAIAAEFAARYARLIGASVEEAACTLFAARPHQLLAAQEQLINQGIELGAFPFGATYGTDYLPVEPVEAMRLGMAQPIPLVVGTNAEEGRLFDRFLKVLPLTHEKIEQLLGDTKPEHKDRITSIYPGYPDPMACVGLAGDLLFGSAAWQIAEAHSTHAPTYMYHYEFAPRTLRWMGLGATHATELLAVFDVYRSGLGRVLTAGGDRSAALWISDDIQARWRAFARTAAPGGDWSPYSTADRAVMVLDRRSRVDHDPHAIRREAWRGFTLTPSMKD